MRPASSCAWSSAGGGDRRRSSICASVNPAASSSGCACASRFRSAAGASWRFTDHEGKTRATWSLRGRVAFSMRAFAPTVQGAIALDFRHALDRLAGLVEGATRPRYALSYPGLRDIGFGPLRLHRAQWPARGTRRSDAQGRDRAAPGAREPRRGRRRRADRRLRQDPCQAAQDGVPFRPSHRRGRSPWTRRGDPAGPPRLCRSSPGEPRPSGGRLVPRHAAHRRRRLPAGPADHAVRALPRRP